MTAPPGQRLDDFVGKDQAGRCQVIDVEIQVRVPSRSLSSGLRRLCPTARPAFGHGHGHEYGGKGGWIRTDPSGAAASSRMGITFITLRRRTHKLLAEVAAASVRMAHRHARCAHPQVQAPRVFEQNIRLAGVPLRQRFVQDLGHDQPTILLTNDRSAAPKLITRYAQRMLIENALSDAVRFFHMDALSSSVGLEVDFDMTLLVIASTLYRLLARDMRGYDQAQAREIFRDLVDMPADLVVQDRTVTVEFHRRSHLPILLASDLFKNAVTVPWWNDARLRLSTYAGTPER
jgi:hypothetical protein